MKAEDITPELLDQIVVTLFEEKTGFSTIYPFVKTDDIADVLWEKHRVPIRRDIKIVRAKMREWWEGKQIYESPLYHYWVGKYAVYLGSPMSRTYCVLWQRGQQKALIMAYTNQRDFSIESDSKRKPVELKLTAIIREEETPCEGCEATDEDRIDCADCLVPRASDSIGKETK